MPVMVCMDGFILTHAYERVDMPTQAQVDAFLPPYEPRQVLDPPSRCPSARWSARGVHGGALPRARQASCALELIPQIAAGIPQRCSAATAGGLVPLPRTGTRRSSSRSARCSARSRTRSTSCATGCKIGVLGITSFRPFPLAAVREALAQASACRARRSLAVGHRRHLANDVRAALSGIPDRWLTVVGAGGRKITQASLHGLPCSARPMRDDRAADLPGRRLDQAMSSASSNAGSASRRPRSGPAAEEHPARRRRGVRPQGGRRRRQANIRQSSTRPAPSRSATACSRRAAQRQASSASNALNSGPPRLPGLRRGARRARYALDAAMRAADGS